VCDCDFNLRVQSLGERETTLHPCTVLIAMMPNRACVHSHSSDPRQVDDGLQLLTVVVPHRSISQSVSLVCRCWGYVRRAWTGGWILCPCTIDRVTLGNGCRARAVPWKAGGIGAERHGCPPSRRPRRHLGLHRPAVMLLGKN
jgi:hypothetical protein